MCGLPSPQSLHCRHSERHANLSSLIPSYRDSQCGDFDVEVRDPRRRFSGFGRNSGCCRPAAASAGRARCAGRQISCRQISRRQEPNGQIPGGGPGCNQGLSQASLHARHGPHGRYSGRSYWTARMGWSSTPGLGRRLAAVAGFGVGQLAAAVMVGDRSRNLS